MSGNVSETAHNLTPTKNCVIVKLNVAPCDAEELNHEYIGNNLGNIAQNANDNMVPPPPNLRLQRCFVCPCIRSAWFSLLRY